MRIFPLIPRVKIRTPLIVFMVFCFLFTQMFGFVTVTSASWLSTAYAASDDEEIFDVVALVVEKDLIDEDLYAPGLIQEYPKLVSDDTLSERIMRYAEDVQENSPRTVVKILKYDQSEDTLLDIISALENFYKNGVEDVTSRLAGAVFIGQIPLPVVNKNGNRFVSMLPLTDFDDKYYVSNPLTQTFDRSDQVKAPGLEIWHGVLRAPQLDEDENVNSTELNKLAEFFDKNHLYYSGEPEFSEFERKLFYADLMTEDKFVNEENYKLYENYLKSMDDLAYMRFNKHWAEDLAGGAMEDLKETLAALDPSGDTITKEEAGLKEEGFTDEEIEKMGDPGNRLIESIESDGEGGSFFDQLPDIQSKLLIEKYNVPYTSVVFKAIALSNDFSKYTARYSVDSGGIDTVPALMAMKDKFTQEYLKVANDAIEEKVNYLVGLIAEKLPIIDYTAVSGDIGGDAFSIGYWNRSLDCDASGFDPLFGLTCSKYPPHDTLSLLTGLVESTCGDQTILECLDDLPDLVVTLLGFNEKELAASTPLYFRNHYLSGGSLYVNGISSSDLWTPKQCFPYLGTMYDETSEDYSVLTRSIRSDDMMTGQTTYGLGVNGVGLSPVEAMDTMKLGDVFDHGLLIEENSEYGYPDFYNDSLLHKPPDDPKLEQGDVIIDLKDFKYVIDTFVKLDKSPPSVNYKLVKDSDLRTTVPIAPVEVKAYGKTWSFTTDAPLVECSACKMYKDLVGEPPVEGLDKKYEFSPDTVIDPFGPGFIRIDGKDDVHYYYLSSKHGTNTVQITGQSALDDAVKSFTTTVLNSKDGGSDKGKIYYNDDSSFNLTYFDSSENLVKDFGEIKLDDLSPIYSLQSNSEAYANNDLKGCFYSSALLHDDRCFARIATYPVFDVAGSYEPFSSGKKGMIYEYNGETIYNNTYSTPSDAETIESSGVDVLYKHEFPAGQEVLEKNEDDPEKYEDYKTHAEMFQLPAGRDFSEIDDIYMDACFNFLPAKYKDSESQGTWPSYDLYSETAGMMYIFGAKEGKKNENLPYGGGGRNVTDVDSTEQFILNTDPVITLADFAEHFGLYDGVDNDGDGDPGEDPEHDNIDYDEIDTDGDGVIDQLKLDLGEADPKYGLDPENIYMVGRYLLGPRYEKWKNPRYFYTYATPPANEVVEGESKEVEYWYPMPVDIANSDGIFDPDEDILLRVKPNTLDVFGAALEIPSLIIHNEPTNYTISQQVNAGVVQSLPIDDPRYVAFLDKNGDVQKLDYPNLFEAGEMACEEALEDVEVDGQAQFAVNVDCFAGKLVSIPGAASKLAGVTDGSLKEYIKEQILSVSTKSPEPISVFADHVLETRSADANVLKDALYWNGLSVDDKHEYILQYYLNRDLKAYVKDSDNGYEAAYLVLDGASLDKGDHVDMAFNRGMEEDSFEEDYLPEGSTFEEMFPDTDESGYPKEKEEDKDKVWKWIPFGKWIKDELWPKIQELYLFAKYFPENVSTQPICGETCQEDCDAVLTELKLSAERYSAYSDGIDILKVVVTGYDQDGAIFKGGEYPDLEIIISQDSLNPVFEADKNDFQKTLNNEGQATYKLRATTDPGGAKVVVKATFPDSTGLADVVSDELQLTTSQKSIYVLSDTATLVAGDEEEIEVVAQLIGKGKVDLEATDEVTFKIVEGEEFISFVGDSVVNAERGIASIKIKSAEKAGIAVIQAEATGDAFYSSGQKESLVVPNKPAKIKIISDTNVLVGNNESKANVKFELYDKFENLAYNAFTKMGVFIFGDAKLDQTNDLDPLIPGVQMNFVEGYADIIVNSKDKIGEANLYAVLLDNTLDTELVKAAKEGLPIDFSSTIGASKKLTVLGEAKMQISVSDNKIDADGESMAHITVKLTKANGEVLTGYNGFVNFNIADPSIAEFAENSPVNMGQGEAKVYVRSTTRAGDTNVAIVAPGFADGSVDLTTLPGEAVKIVLSSKDDVILTDSEEGTVLQAKLMDEFDNLAYLTQATVSFGVTAGTASMVEFMGNTITPTVDGKAEVKVKSSGKSGVANLVAESPNLEKGKLGLNLKKRISEKTDFDQMSPKALYINLLGAPYGDLGQNDLASSLLFNGQSQAVLTTTADDNNYKKLVFVDGYGQIDILDKNVMPVIVNANDSFGFTRVKFFDNMFGDELGEMFVVPKENLNLIMVGPTGAKELAPLATPAASMEGILVKRITEDAKAPIFEVSEDQKTIYIKDGDNTAASINNLGQVNIVSDQVTLKIPGEEKIDKTYFSILILWKGKPLGQVVYKQDIETGVQTLSSKNNFENYWPGVYLKLFDDDSHFGASSAFSRYSTEFARGGYIVDLDQEMDASMAPGLPYDSLEAAGEESGVGFKEGNKNMLLFAAGNTVGESNIPYTAESGILMGDPTIRVDNSEGDLVSASSGYTKDVGKLIYSGEDVIKEIITFDYNGDEREDILLVYENGKVRLLENELSNKMYADRGIVLNIVNGILSLSKIDINNDGFDDLIIGTKDSCIKDEQCLYIYENDNGNFVRKNLNLNTADKIYEMFARDLNNDNLPDIALSDSSGNVYVFWNEDGEIDPMGDKLGNFSIHVEGIEMIDDVLVYYPGLLSGISADQSQYLVEMTVKQKDYNYFINDTELYVKPGYSGVLPQPSPQDPFKKEYNAHSFNDYSGELPATISNALSFILPKRTSTFNGSTKTAADLNGAPIGLGDEIEHKITLKNNSGKTIKGLKISDLTPPNQGIEYDSLKCLDSGCDDELYWEDASPPHRSKVIAGVSVPANGKRTIVYKARMMNTPKVSLSLGDFEIDAGVNHDLYFDILVRPDINQADLLTYFNSDNELDGDGHVVYQQLGMSTVIADNLVEDEFGAIPSDEEAEKEAADAKAAQEAQQDAYGKNLEEVGSVSVSCEDQVDEVDDEIDCDAEGNEGEFICKCLEDGPDAFGPSDSKDENVQEERSKCICERGVRVPPEEVDKAAIGPMADIVDKVVSDQRKDADFDGLADSWDSVQAGLQGAADWAASGINYVNDLAAAAAVYVEDALKMFKCSGAGCLPIPWNNAFLVPMDMSGSGGFAAFAWGSSPCPPCVSAFYPSSSVSAGRIYISPTLTMGLGIAVCIGPVQAAACYVFSLPVGAIFEDMCKWIEKKFQAAINKAAKFVNDAVDELKKGVEKTTFGVVNVSGGSSAQNSAKGSGNGNYGGSSSPLIFDMKSNIDIPGFPSVFTNWIDAQIEEIYNKLLDGLDLYLILPAFGSLVNDSVISLRQFGEVNHFQDVLKYISKIPMIQIKGEEIMFKIPILQKEQYTKWERQAKLFKENIDKQIEKIKEFWTCDKSSESKTLCDKVIGDLTELTASIQKNLDVIEQYKNLPKKILEWRTVEQKYATQIICYLDAVMDIVGGYIKKQASIINSWMKAIADMIEQFKSWKALLKLIVEYQQSCDKCKNERHGMLGILMQLFVAIPEPPVIPFPKIPDFVLDLSKIKMGVEILWPDVMFQPEPIILPDIPTITIPDIIPELYVKAPGIPILPSFDFDFDFPDLPPLKMPKLPDIPKPFKIPSLPKLIVDLVATIKAILKLLCLLKQALIPVPEVTPTAASLKTEIETLTNSGVTPVLPITLAFAVNLPEITYETPVEFRWTLHQKYGVSTAAIYYLVENAASWWNKKIEEYVAKINKYMQRVGSFAQGAVDLESHLEKTKEWLKKKGIELPDEKIEIDLGEDESEEESKIYYLLAEEDEFNLDSSEYAKYYKDIDEFDYVDVDKYADSNMSELANLRNSVLEYALDLEAPDIFTDSEVMIAEQEDTLNDKFHEMIASTSGSAGSLAESSAEPSAEPPKLQVQSVSLFAMDLSKDRKDLDRMLIALNDMGDELGGGTDSQTSGFDLQFDDGLKIISDGEEEVVVNYNAEIDDSTALMFVDADNDDDMDILYSLRGDLYLKSNYKNTGAAPNEYPVLDNSVPLSDYSTSVLSVQGYASDSENNGVATVSFIPSNDEHVVGYEIAVYPSLIELDDGVYSGTYRYFAAKNADGVYGATDDVASLSNVISAPEREIYNSLSSFGVSEGVALYAVKDSVFVLKNSDGFKIDEVELSQKTFYIIPAGISATDVEIMSGSLELMKKGKELKEQALTPGKAFMIGDTITASDNGGADVSLSGGTFSGAKIHINENEKFEILNIKDIKKPSIELNIPNGNYYSVVYALTDTGERSYESVITALSPQVCADDTPPLPALSSTTREIAVMEVLTLDASSSFDPGGDIEAYYLDTDLVVDSDGDGDTLNDKDMWADPDNSVDGPDADDVKDNDMLNTEFKIGPYEEVGDYQVALNIVDTAHNVSSQIVNIHVYVPKINLDPVYKEMSVVTGDTDPETGNMLYKLIRERGIPRVIDGKLKLVIDEETVATPSANDKEQYITAGDGSYVISDFNTEDIILVVDAEGNTVAEIDEVTGNFYVYEEDGYSYVIQPADPPNDSTKVEIVDPDGNVVATLYFVSDGNLPVDVHEWAEFTSDSVKDLTGVDVSDVDTQDEFVFKKFPMTDPNYPGGVYLYYTVEDMLVVAIDTAGNIDLVDDRMSLKKKDNQYKFDPFVYELWFESKKVAEVYVSTKGLFDVVQIVGPNDVPRKFPNGLSPQYLYEEAPSPFNVTDGSAMEPPIPLFNDTAGALYDYAMSLYYIGVISGDENLNPEALASRAEFAVTLLKMLCIVPRKEAYEEPSVFSDIPYDPENLPYYYPFVKEGALLELLYGYGGEEDPVTKMTPFKPDATINFAEAVAMILRGLDLKKTISLEGVAPKEGESWFDPLLEVAQNLNTYAVDGVTLKNSSLISFEEAKNPERLLTNADLIELAFRVIDAYNCHEVDDDTDGMPDYCEEKYGIDDPSADPDEDNLINSDECYYGTDPNDPDTDKGGQLDGDEIFVHGTNPLYGVDDYPDTDGDGLMDIEELKIYHTDPNKKDTDGGGVNDGDEVQKQMDPLDADDDAPAPEGEEDQGVGQIFKTEPGIYLVPPECNTCPCLSTFKYKADLRSGDILYTIIVNNDNSKVYAKSNEQKVE